MSVTGQSRYTVISADTHAGGSHAAYREFLEAKYRRRIRRLARRVQEPVRRPAATTAAPATGTTSCASRSWTRTGSSARSCSRTRCRRSFRPPRALRPPPPTARDYERRLAGIRAHNRWLGLRSAAAPERRAGIGQIFLNDVDDAMQDVTLHQGARAARWRPAPGRPADADGSRRCTTRTTTGCGRSCEDLEVTAQLPLGHRLARTTARYAVADAAVAGRDVVVLAPAPCAPHPAPAFSSASEPEVRRHRAGRVVGPAARWRRSTARSPEIGVRGRDRRDRFKSATHRCRKSADRVLPAELLDRRQLPQPASTRTTRDSVGIDKFMWGSDYPARRGHVPVHHASLRRSFHAGTDPAELPTVLAGNAASVYGLRPRRAGPEPRPSSGPTVDEVRQPVTSLPADANEALLKNAAAA